MKTEGNNLFDGFVQVIRDAVADELQKALNANHNPPKLLLDTKEAAAVLNVPESWMGQAARENKIATVRVGHYVRFRLVDLEKFIEDKKGKNQ
jgi:excisionase family DNA binding protein